MIRPLYKCLQGENVTNCNTCNAPFHKKCFLNCSHCPACPKDWTNDQGDIRSNGNENVVVEKHLTINNNHEHSIPHPYVYIHDRESNVPLAQSKLVESSSIHLDVKQKKKGWSSYKLVPKSQI